MTIKIESFASVFVVAIVVWYLATRTNLGESFTSDVVNIPERFTGWFDRPQAIIRRQPDIYRRESFR